MAFLKNYFSYHQERLLFFMALFLGMFTFELKLVSFSQIIRNVGLENFAVVMILLALCQFLFNRFFGRLLKHTSQIIFPSFIVSGLLLLIFVTFFKSYLDFWSAFSIFIFGQFISNSIELLFAQVVHNNVSLLKNPKVSAMINIALELGGLLAPLIVILGENNRYIYVYKLLPVFGILIAWGYCHRKNIETKSDNLSYFAMMDKYPFLWAYLVFILTIAIFNNYFNFSLFYGIDLLKSTSGMSIEKMFSTFNFVQTFFVLIVLIPNLFKKSLNNDWFIPTTIFNILTVCLLASQAAFNLPTVLIATAILRKAFSRALLNNSMTLLSGQFPEDDKMSIRMMSEILCTNFSYFIIGLISFCAVNLGISISIIAAVLIIVSMIGIFFSKKLFVSLGQFHVSNIVRTNVYGAVQSIYALGPKLYSSHVTALISLLERGPRPILQKAIVTTLGRMGDARAIPSIMKLYESSNREDIQLICIRSLLGFKSHYVRYKIVEYISKMITGQVSLGEIRKSVIKEIIINFPEDTMIYGLFKIINDAKEQKDQRILANVILVVGELAQKRNDNDLYTLLLPFLDFSYTRRVRANTIIFLYHSKKFNQDAIAAFESLLTSNDPLDLGSVAFVVGELKLNDFTNLIYDYSANNGHTNSTFLISLLKLGHKDGAKLFTQFLFTETNEEEIYKGLNQFGVIQNELIRYRVYEELLNQYPDSISQIINRLRQTKRDFDTDRTAIANECLKRGILLESDNKLFSEGKK